MNGAGPWKVCARLHPDLDGHAAGFQLRKLSFWEFHDQFIQWVPVSTFRFKRKFLVALPISLQSFLPQNPISFACAQPERSTDLFPHCCQTLRRFLEAYPCSALARRCCFERLFRSRYHLFVVMRFTSSRSSSPISEGRISSASFISMNDRHSSMPWRSPLAQI